MSVSASAADQELQHAKHAKKAQQQNANADAVGANAITKTNVSTVDQPPITIILLEGNHLNFIPYAFLPQYFLPLRQANIPIAVAVENRFLSIENMEEEILVIREAEVVKKWLKTKLDSKENRYHFTFGELQTVLRENTQIRPKQKVDMLRAYQKNPEVFINYIINIDSENIMLFETRKNFSKKLYQHSIPLYFLEEEYKERIEMESALLFTQNTPDTVLSIYDAHEKGRIAAHVSCIKTIIQKLSLQGTGGVIFVTDLGTLHGKRLEAHLNILKKQKQYNFNMSCITVQIPNYPVQIGNQRFQFPKGYSLSEAGFEELSRKVDSAEIKKLYKESVFQKLMFTQDPRTLAFISSEFNSIIGTIINTHIPRAPQTKPLLLNPSTTDSLSSLWTWEISSGESEWCLEDLPGEPTCKGTQYSICVKGPEAGAIIISATEISSAEAAGDLRVGIRVSGTSNVLTIFNLHKAVGNILPSIHPNTSDPQNQRVDIIVVSVPKEYKRNVGIKNESYQNYEGTPNFIMDLLKPPLIRCHSPEPRSNPNSSAVVTDERMTAEKKENNDKQDKSAMVLLSNTARVATGSAAVASPQFVTASPITIILLEGNHCNFIPYVFLPHYFLLLQQAKISVAVAIESPSFSLEDLEKTILLNQEVQVVKEWLDTKLGSKDNQYHFTFSEFQTFLKENKQIRPEIKVNLLLLLESQGNPEIFTDYIVNTSENIPAFEARKIFWKRLSQQSIPLFFLEDDCKEHREMESALLFTKSTLDNDVSILAANEKARMAAHVKCIKGIIQKLSLEGDGGVIFVTDLGSLHGKRLEAHLNILKKKENYNFNMFCITVQIPNYTVQIGNLPVQFDGDFSSSEEGFEKLSQKVDSPEIKKLYKESVFQKLMFTQDSRTQAFISSEFSRIIGATINNHIPNVPQTRPLLLTEKKENRDKSATALLSNAARAATGSAAVTSLQPITPPAPMANAATKPQKI